MYVFEGQPFFEIAVPDFKYIVVESMKDIISFCIGYIITSWYKDYIVSLDMYSLPDS